jgi:hypothetical protein
MGPNLLTNILQKFYEWNFNIMSELFHIKSTDGVYHFKKKFLFHFTKIVNVLQSVAHSYFITK